MGFTTSNPVSVDNATKADDYDDVFDNTIALAAARIDRHLGGSQIIAYTDTTYVDIDGAVYITIDASNLSGLTVIFAFMAMVASGTGYARVYNINAAAAVASSEVTFTNTSKQRKVSAALTLASADNQYKVQVKGSVAGALPRVWGASLNIY